MHDVGRFAWLNEGNVKYYQSWLGEQLLDPPDLACINDDFEIHDVAKYEEQQTALLAFMSSMSHDRASTFETYDQQEEYYRHGLKFLPRYVNGTLINVPSLVNEGVVRLNAKPAN